MSCPIVQQVCHRGFRELHPRANWSSCRIAALSWNGTRTRPSGFARQARQQVDVSHCLDRLFCTRAMPIIPILLTGRRAASSPVHPTDATAANRRRTTALPRAFRFGCAPRRVVGALHGVDGHFDLVPPPTSTGSGCLVSLRTGIGASELAASRAGDATLRALAPVVTLSAMIA
jgi:hypothetical protein